MPSPLLVLDTNVLVAAGFNPRSASARIVDAVKQGRLRMVWNDATRREIERIVQQIPPLRLPPVVELCRCSRPANSGRFSCMAACRRGRGAHPEKSRQVMYA